MIYFLKTCLLFTLMSLLSFSFAREIKPIRKKGPTAKADPTIKITPLSRNVCIRQVRKILNSYGTPAFSSFLDQNFPNAGQLKRALSRVELRAKNIQLNLESVRRAVPGPWRKVRGQGFNTIYEAKCSVEIQTRLSFDSPTTGKRVIRNPSRLQWQFSLRAKQK